MLIDKHNREISYLRLAVTDHCNLRCSYCMPANMRFAPSNELLNDAEIIKLLTLLAAEGIEKVRITGGEPFSRKGLMPLLERMSSIEGMKSIALTTNGTLIYPYIQAIKSLGIININLSLDTLRAERFQKITRRDAFEEVWKALHALVLADMNVKLNVVLMAGVNTDEVIDFVNLGRQLPITVRFIEEMPFNGAGNAFSAIKWDYQRILHEISNRFDLLPHVALPGSTAVHYSIPGHVGLVGVIPAYSRTFCGTCNRLRITAKGGLKTCLYGDNIINVKDLMRMGCSNERLLNNIQYALNQRFADGWETEQYRDKTIHESMSEIGG